MWVDIDGEGPPIVLVHGLGGTSSVFEPLTEYLRTTNTVLRFDLRGHGRSGRMSEPSVAAWADDLDALLDMLPTASADFVGIGLGALILEHFVATRPNRVRRMVLINPLHGLAEQHRARYRRLAAIVRSDGIESLLRETGQEFGTAPETPPSILRAFRRELLLAQDPESYAAACEAIAGTYTSDLAFTTVPTLILVGVEATESIASAQTIVERIDGATMAKVRGLASWPTIEQPDQVAARIAAFLGPDLIDGAA
ncbi:MAG: alpha/beta hydrolase [Actinomycetota bacterium]